MLIAVISLPVYSRARGIVLDTILGPPEDFNYVSRTAPIGQPPD